MAESSRAQLAPSHCGCFVFCLLYVPSIQLSTNKESVGRGGKRTNTNKNRYIAFLNQCRSTRTDIDNVSQYYSGIYIFECTHQ